MLRSPIFYFIIVLFISSCEEKKTITPETKAIRKEAFSLREKADENYQKQNFNTAFYEFSKSKAIFESLKDSPTSSKDSANIGYILIQMASIQQVNGDYYGSKETVTEALPFVKNNKNYISCINNLLGIADKELSLYDDAIYYYRESVKYSKDLAEKQYPLSNIAALYIQQKKYNKAISILEFLLESPLSKKILMEKTKVNTKATYQDNLGYAYFKNGNEEKGFDLMQEGLRLRIENEDTYGSIESYLHLADYYSKKDLKKSDENALKAYTISTKLNSVDERLEALQILISNNNSPQDTKYVKKYFTLNDSIIKVRNNFKNKFAKIKYDSKKEKDENEKLRLEKAENQLSLQRASYMRIVFAIVFVFLVILIAILIRYFKNKNKAIELKTSYDTETRIAKKIHDELANDVFQVIAFAESQPLSTENTKENLLQKLDDIYGRVRGISRENNSIDTGINFTRTIKEMLSAYNTKERNIMVTNLEQINWETIDDMKKITISRILQELMVNMKKHSGANLVVIKFESDQKSILINYMDNGVGCEKSTIVKNGLQNMSNRILAVNGTFDIETEIGKGFKVKITMPEQTQIKA
ncbi:signal transduction histidine kinase [Flavobacterium nitrogenifigens]|uniref:histidine kinase n=2 Tax=Flavobacterium TaxID=237 RepID=A0A7W7N682_9FLAO|nr:MULTISPECIES: tetratricopeptide repeat-containing sensor histidine kinase [Flavobacterium]MBB4801545.1 signal transduction histidine kinase [Flavobacterium nitrogenifigens]MBB6386502.1 signal transduction histidine kinase [Flavobacterium notoginsengisoli]